MGEKRQRRQAAEQVRQQAPKQPRKASLFGHLVGMLVPVAMLGGAVALGRSAANDNGGPDPELALGSIGVAWLGLTLLRGRYRQMRKERGPLFGATRPVARFLDRTLVVSLLLTPGLALLWYALGTEGPWPDRYPCGLTGTCEDPPYALVPWALVALAVGLVFVLIQLRGWAKAATVAATKAAPRAKDLAARAGNKPAGRGIPLRAGMDEQWEMMRRHGPETAERAPNAREPDVRARSAFPVIEWPAAIASVQQREELARLSQLIHKAESVIDETAEIIDATSRRGEPA